MTTLHIELDESVAEAIREKAEREGKTLEAWVAEAMTRQIAVPPDPNKQWIVDMLERARISGGDSQGKKWKREDLYER